jgi:hypothetical protein
MGTPLHTALAAAERWDPRPHADALVPPHSFFFFLHLRLQRAFFRTSDQNFRLHGHGGLRVGRGETEGGGGAVLRAGRGTTHRPCRGFAPLSPAAPPPPPPASHTTKRDTYVARRQLAGWDGLGKDGKWTGSDYRASYYPVGWATERRGWRGGSYHTETPCIYCPKTAP